MLDSKIMAIGFLGVSLDTPTLRPQRQTKASSMPVAQNERAERMPRSAAAPHHTSLRRTLPIPQAALSAAAGENPLETSYNADLPK